MQPQQHEKPPEQGGVFISICIPHFARHRHLIALLESIKSQTYRGYEVCISDDTPENYGPNPIREHLAQSGLAYRYVINPKPERYDGNLRKAIALSKGKYILLFGNDDCFNSRNDLKLIAQHLEANEPVGAAVCNYHEQASGRKFTRCKTTQAYPGTPDVACRNFRNFAFVSGVVLNGPLSRASFTANVDGSEMYQMYLMAACLAAGNNLLSISEDLVVKDIEIPGEHVDSVHSTKSDDRAWKIRERPMTRILATVAAGIATSTPCANHKRALGRAAISLHLFTYPFWGVEFRRTKPFRYALGVMLGSSPNRTCKGVGLRKRDKALIWAIYWTMLPTSLFIPVKLFDLIRGPLYKIAKRRGATTSG